MRILDSVTDDKFHKHILVEDGGSYLILDQVAGHKPELNQARMDETKALSSWRELLIQSLSVVTHNAADAYLLAERRLATLH